MIPINFDLWMLAMDEGPGEGVRALHPPEGSCLCCFIYAEKLFAPSTRCQTDAEVQPAVIAFPVFNGLLVYVMCATMRNSTSRQTPCPL